jgi:hypothetical protein
MSLQDESSPSWAAGCDSGHKMNHYSTAKQHMGSAYELESMTCNHDSNEDLCGSLFLVGMDDGSTCCSTTCMDDSTASLQCVWKLDPGEEEDAVVGDDIRKDTQPRPCFMVGSHQVKENENCIASSSTSGSPCSNLKKQRTFVQQQLRQQQFSSPRQQVRSRLRGRLVRASDSIRNRIQPISMSIKSLPRELILIGEDEGSAAKLDFEMPDNKQLMMALKNLRERFPCPPLGHD